MPKKKKMWVREKEVIETIEEKEFEGARERQREKETEGQMTEEQILEEKREREKEMIDKIEGKEFKGR